MEMKIEQSISAYGHDGNYYFDNEIALNYYPKRLVEKLAVDGGVTGKSLLELGLGHGYTAIIFDGLFKDYTVLEGDPRIIERFQSNSPECKAHIVQTFFEDYKPNRTFDVIVAGFILEHVEDPEIILNMYKNYLADRGRLFIAVPNAEAMNRRLGHIAGDLANMQELSVIDISCGHRRYFTLDSIKGLCERTGLTVQNIEGIYLKPFTMEQIMSLDLEKKYLDALCVFRKGLSGIIIRYPD